MHFDHGRVPPDYAAYLWKKRAVVGGMGILMLACFLAAIGVGAVPIGLPEILKTLSSAKAVSRVSLIVWEIRLPQALCGLLAGAGLACSGAVMQSVLKNPLASPFTLGISHAAAFGAALAIMAAGSVQALPLGGNLPLVTILSAFFFAGLTALLIILIAGSGRDNAQALVLTGVALGSLFTAGTMLLQYFADDVQLAAMVFWTFGDLARADWADLKILGPACGLLFVFFHRQARGLNTMGLGDENATGLGINVKRLRLSGMAGACLLTALIISFVGIIGFVGLVAPHIARRILGDDHCFLLPASLLTGGLILLASDLAARVIMAPHVLPVSILTSFLGAPVFIYLLVKGKGL